MNKFKDKMNRWRTRSLFKEFSTDPESVLFTLDEAKELYIATGDITGYAFATEHLGGWKHWLACRRSPQLNSAIEEWEFELEIKLRSDGIKNMLRLSKGDKGLQAARYFADANWKPKEKGRPTKEKIEKEAKIHSRLYEEFEDVLDNPKH